MMALWFTVGVIVVAILVAAAIPMVIAMLRVARRWSIEKRSPLLRREARVVDKRTALAGSGATNQRYYVTFELTSGNRVELDLPGRESGMLVVGDQGTLAWQGPRYLGFAREILR